MSSGSPPIWIGCAMRSRVVPGTAVTIATSSPASAFSRLDLPTFGAPDQHDVQSVAQHRALLRPPQHVVERRAHPRQATRRVGLFQEVDLFLGEVERGLDQCAQLDQLRG